MKKASPICPKKAIHWLKNGLIFVLLLGFAFFFIIEGWQSSQCVKAIEQHDLNHYQGHYELIEKKTVRNTVHVLKLENGDIITVPYTDNNEFFYGDNSKLKEFSELEVYYSKQKFLSWSWTSACISIESSDGETLILNSEITQKELEGRAIFGFCMGIVWLILLVVCSVPLFNLICRAKGRRKRKSR